MIIGHGIDLQEISAVEKAFRRNERFAQKVLTSNELAIFNGLTGKRQITYLAGRWSAKEAFSKALGTGIGKLSFHHIEVLSDKKGRPYISRSPFNGNSFVSISHSGDYVQASVILEEE
ncbi:holo-ACP synthase [Streptococcus parauberis]|uniref:Holo-[acyl-carrier-protein] synthase n=3 Tax=Streptococcus parauberis TaxID=1348 RepID=A0A0E2UDW5_9STRE|nr:holo-ACP synthase [Streptococcus parauberis]AEF24615.1 holo-(acyl carrier protein) synthase [Streptococcus parauberis KCTC 11537]AUT05099.1 Holo-[acyl-carrier-protein] synthase [Streptococcus parauberis]EGE53217.1 holo-[acyl-carrier-protein] synthase [Streptococcus parauberis NCFD 2020]EMF48441.1 Holo-[acyl-carrier protein] synthase [Streptococcus parauberis KRS-02109]EMG25192.1 Holo-[acyl-carrier protein] synthase [Streptococcus parauberis KRS-02083]